jgi:hypothetical protein
MHQVAFSGSREYQNRGLVLRVLERLLQQHGDDLFVHVGDARGLDAMVRVWCQGTLPQRSFKVHNAHWRRLGPVAGHERNGRVVQHAAVLFAFFDSSGITPGTADAVGQALDLGIQVHLRFERSGKWQTIPAGWLQSLGCGRLEAWERITRNLTDNSTTAPPAGA